MASLSRSLVLVALVDAHASGTCSTGRECVSEDLTLLQGTQSLHKHSVLKNNEKTVTPGEHAYLGCFVDNGARDFNFGPRASGGTGYTFASCDQACAGYTFMALQFGGECFCDNEFGFGEEEPYAQVDDSECAMTRAPCSSNSYLCGGGWRQAVYARNLPPHYIDTLNSIDEDLDAVRNDIDDIVEAGTEALDAHGAAIEELQENQYLTVEFIHALAGDFQTQLDELHAMGAEAIGANAEAIGANAEAIQELESGFSSQLGQLHHMVEAAQAQAGSQIDAVAEYVANLETRLSAAIADLHSLGLEALDAQAEELDGAIADLAEHQQEQLGAVEAHLTSCIADLLRMAEEGFSEHQSQIDALASHIARVEGITNDRLTELEDRVEALEANPVARVTVDGCRNQGTERARNVVFESDGPTTASVRCCSVNGNVCDSDGFSGGCRSEATFNEAQEYCASNGWRLCTEQQMWDRVCCGTGCNYDSASVWVLA